MKRVLFVDDDPGLLEATERMLSVMRGKWDMKFVTSGAEALKVLAKGPVDAIVSDMVMPEMTGAELLNEVMQKYPHTIRFILSAHADTEEIMSCVGGTHQFLAKPCNSETLCAALLRALDMEGRINVGPIRALVSQLSTVPSLPSLYFEILKELRSPSVPLERIGNLIARDPAMTVKILHVVNSVHFGLGRKLTDPTEAVVQLGIETIKSLVLVLHLFEQCDCNPEAKLQVQRLHHHSLAAASLAKGIGGMTGRGPGFAEECFTAGLLHDIGRLVLAANLPGDFEHASQLARLRQWPMVETERIVFGVNHAEVGGYLIGLWGLPMPMAEAAAYHHTPQNCGSKELSPLTVVHVADVFSHEGKEHPAEVPPELQPDYLTSVGVLEKVAAWRAKLQADQDVPA